MASEPQQPARCGFPSCNNSRETPIQNQSNCPAARHLDFATPEKDTPNTATTYASLREKELHDPYESLPDDVYSFIALSRAPSPGRRSKSISIFIALAVFLFQIFGLGLMILSKVHPRWSENEDIDNPHPYFFNSLKYIDSFIPTNESRLVQMSQVFGALAFIVSQEQDTLSDLVQSFDILLSVLFGNQKNTDCCFTISWLLRLTQGTWAGVTAVLLGLSSSDVVDIILNFTAINYISGIDERVFDMAHDGWLGEYARTDARRIRSEKRYIVTNNGIQTDDIRVVQEGEKVPTRRAAWIAICWLFFWFFLPIIIVFVVQNHTDVMATKIFRVRFDEENLRSYSGCYKNTGKKSHRRIVYTAGNTSNPGASFSYCRPDKKWHFLKEDINPCSFSDGAIDDEVKDKEGAHTSGGNFAFDIQTTFESQWVSPHNRHLGIHFIENTEGQSEYDFCKAEIGDGICDDDLNFFDYEYDGGDCCATTCTGPKCGKVGEPIFGVHFNESLSFPNCTNDEMVGLPITLKSFEYNDIEDIQNTIGDRNVSRFRWENDEVIETDWEEFWQKHPSSHPTLELVCDKKRVFFVRITEAMKNMEQKSLLSKGSDCSLILNTFEPIVNVDVTWPFNVTDSSANSGIHVKKVIRNTIPPAIGKLTVLSANKISIDLCKYNDSLQNMTSIHHCSVAFKITTHQITFLPIANGHVEGTIPTEIGLMKQSIKQLELGK